MYRIFIDSKSFIKVLLCFVYERNHVPGLRQTLKGQSVGMREQLNLPSWTDRCASSVETAHSSDWDLPPGQYGSCHGLQDRKDLWHWTQRCEMWKGRCLLPETLAPCLRTSPTAHSWDRTPSLSHISRKTWEDSELCPVEICRIQSLLKNTLQFQREDMFWLKCFAWRFPTNSNYNKNFQNSTALSFLSCFAHLLHSLSFQLQLGHSITNTLPLLNPLIWNLLCSFLLSLWLAWNQI